MPTYEERLAVTRTARRGDRPAPPRDRLSPLTPDEGRVVALQRLIGNRAAVELLAAPGAGERDAGPAAPPARSLTATGDATTIRRMIGFEAEMMIPSLGPSHNSLTYTDKDGFDDLFLTDKVKSFIDGGVPYGTDIGGKGTSPIRIDSDHSGDISRDDIVAKLKELGHVDGVAKEPNTKVEFVTEPVDELAPKSNETFKTLGLDLKSKMQAALDAAKSKDLKQLGAPAKAGYFTGIPIGDFRLWLSVKDFKAIEPLLLDFVNNKVADRVYLQATVGIIPSGIRTFLGTAMLSGGAVELSPPSEGRQQVLSIVQSVINELESSPKFKEDDWVKALDPSSHEAFMGILSLVYSYLLGDTLHQTTAGTASTAKNAVPFLIKHGPWNLTGLGGTQTLRDKPPSREFARRIGSSFKGTKYLQAKYWIESDEGTATAEGKIAKPVEARAPAAGFLTGDYVDVVEALLTSGGAGVTAVRGKEIPSYDSLPADAGGVNVHYESFNQKGIPLEYRWITKQYQLGGLLPALNEIIKEVRTANMKELTEEQKTTVKAAFAET